MIMNNSNESSILIDTIPEISELNTVNALRLMAGNKKLYHKILRKFYTSQKNSGELIREKLKALYY